MFIMLEWETENSIDSNMLHRRTEILNKCRHKSKYALISYDSKDQSRFLLKVSTKCFTQNYCFQESAFQESVNQLSTFSVKRYLPSKNWITFNFYTSGESLSIFFAYLLEIYQAQCYFVHVVSFYGNLH